MKQVFHNGARPSVYRDGSHDMRRRRAGRLVGGYTISRVEDHVMQPSHESRHHAHCLSFQDFHTCTGLCQLNAQANRRLSAHTRALVQGNISESGIS